MLHERTALVAAVAVAICGAVASARVQLHNWNGQNQSMNDQAVSDDGEVIAYSYFNWYYWREYVEVRDTQTGHSIRPWAYDDPDRPVTLLGLSGDGGTVLASALTGEVAVWTGGSRYDPLPLPGAASFEITHTTSGAPVVGLCTMPDASTKPTLWTSATPTALGVDGTIDFVSTEGLVIVGESNGWVYRWENGTAELLVEGVPQAINTDGSVVVGESSTGNKFLWRDGVLDPNRWGRLGGAIDQVSDDGDTVRRGEYISRPGCCESYPVDGAYWMSNDGLILLGDNGQPFVHRNHLLEYLVSPVAPKGGTIQVYDISDDGTVVVGQVTVQHPQYLSPFTTSSVPFIWTTETGIETMCDYLGTHGLMPSNCFGDTGTPTFTASGISRNGQTMFGGFFSASGPSTGAFSIVLAQPCSPADVTTQSAAIGDVLHGVPDGIVTGADIQYNVNLWLQGCP